jgi:hypothetical protein
MTDNNTPPETDEAVTPATEEPQVNLAEEAAKAVRDKPAARAEKVVQQLSQELSPEQLAQVDALVQSKTDSAIDGYRRKLNEDFDSRVAAEGYIKPEEVDSRIAAAMNEAKEVAEAGRNLDHTLISMGIKPDSDEYRKVGQAFKEGLEAGEFTNRTLLSERGIKSVAFAAGVLQPEASPEPPALPGMGSHTQVPRPKADDGKTLDQRAAESMLAGL